MEEEKKLSKKIDRLVMGVILGGAIGSVLGLTLAPRKGKETRDLIKQKGQDLVDKGRNISQKLIRDHKEAIAGAKYQLKKGKGFLRWLFKRNKTAEKMPRAVIETPGENAQED